MKRLAKSGPWLLSPCQTLFEERAPPDPASAGLEIRVVDATTVKEPGRTGSLWRLHYSLRLPSLVCDHFLVTATEGAGTGESFRQFSVSDGDCLVGDRGYATAHGIAHVATSGGNVIVRVNTGSLHFLRPDGQRFDLLTAVSGLDRPGPVACWDVAVDGNGSASCTPGRVCAIRKSGAAIEKAQAALHLRASRNGSTPRPESLEFVKYVIIFTTFPASGFTRGNSRLVPAQMAG